MANYLLGFGGLQNGVAPWSCRFVGTSSASEGTTQTNWDAAVQALWNTATLLPYIPVLTTLTFTYTSTASSQFKQTTKTQNIHNIPGTSTSHAINYRTCEVVTLRTAKATRYGRGRFYLPSLATNACDTTTGYIILPAAMTALGTAVGNFFTSLGANIALQILHRKGSLDGTVLPLTMDPVTASDIPNLFATQRRRGDKVVPTRTAG